MGFFFLPQHIMQQQQSSTKRIIPPQIPAAMMPINTRVSSLISWSPTVKALLSVVFVAVLLVSVPVELRGLELVELVPWPTTKASVGSFFDAGLCPLNSRILRNRYLCCRRSKSRICWLGKSRSQSSHMDNAYQSHRKKLLSFWGIGSG